jgi:UTP--glucose-1-phosphate uridylyltransferase
VVDCLRLIRQRFEAAGLDAASARDFLRKYGCWRTGLSGAGAPQELRVVTDGDLVPLEGLKAPFDGSGAGSGSGKIVWIVLNGGLGTTMKMAGPKSLLPVRGDRTFLDLIAEFALGRMTRSSVALVFMNSFATDAPTRAALSRYPIARVGDDGEALPVCFLQGCYPRIREADGMPYGEAADPEAWAPPGHGDLYDSLDRTGMLDRLLGGGWRYAFVSNADNLGASPSAEVAGYMAREGIEFVMEVTARTEVDVKGGGPVWRGEQLTLLETAQAGKVFDPATMPFFNTNNLWIDLSALRRRTREGGFELPLIVNRKIVAGEPVVQIETAAGAAIGVFERSRLVEVDRRRFAPVKTTDDLLTRRSDLYREGALAPLEPSPEREPSLEPPLVRLDPRYYGSVEELDLRIPDPPSLIAARSLTVTGDVRFGRGIRVRGDTRVENRGNEPLRIPDGAELSGDWK